MLDSRTRSMDVVVLWSICAELLALGNADIVVGATWKSGSISSRSHRHSSTIVFLLSLKFVISITRNVIKLNYVENLR